MAQCVLPALVLNIIDSIIGYCLKKAVKYVRKSLMPLSAADFYFEKSLNTSWFCGGRMFTP